MLIKLMNHFMLFILSLVFIVYESGFSLAFIDKTEFEAREGFLCEPDLLDRRIAEANGRHKRFLEAIGTNSVDLRTKRGACSGTFITNQCVLTAAHCLSEPIERGVRARHPVTGTSLSSGTGYQFQGYSYFDKDKDKKTVSHDDGGDTAIVKFNGTWSDFRPLTVWFFLHNRDFWFHDWDENQGNHLSERAFNRKFWSDFGPLGLTAIAPLSTDQPKKRARCSDAYFGWAPHPKSAVRKHAWDFAEDRISYSGITGPGMSGGAVYDTRGILGTIESGAFLEFNSGDKLESVPGTSFRIGVKTSRRPGYGSNFTLIGQEQAKFIQYHCPGANLQKRFQLKGGRVAEESSRDQLGYVGSTPDPWDELSFSARQTHVSRAMKIGDDGLFIKRLQRQLKRLGFYSDRISGSFDENTLKSVKRYQFKNGLKETGEADIWTLMTMGIMVD